MAWRTWGTWPDVLVDFGKELYVPWRLAAGQRLYADIACFNGPLSPYLNALWFRCFGVGLRTLVWCNLGILAGLVTVLYRVLAPLSDRATATMACLTVVLLCAFGAWLPSGNYNFVCPYSHELTHGLVLSLLAIWCLARYQRKRRLRWLAACGAAVGLVCLTKPEMALPALIALTIGVGLSLGVRRPRRLRRSVGMYVAAVATPILAMWGWLSLQMAPGVAGGGLVSAWSWLVDDRLHALAFYRWCLGTDRLHENFWLLLLWTARYLCFFGVIALVSLRLQGRAWLVWIVGAVVLACCGALLLMHYHIRWVDFWINAFRPLPVCMAALIASTGLAIRRQWRHAAACAPLILRMTLLCFAGALLVKILLNARLHHYGFALALPATALLMVALLQWIPSAIDRRGGTGDLFRVAVMVVWLAAVLTQWQTLTLWSGGETHRVGRGADAFLADARGTVMQAAVEYLAARTPPDATLVVVPEGAMLNYQARRINPTPYLYVQPAVLISVGEERIRAAFAAHPPDYIALVVDRDEPEDHRDEGHFGIDYGHHLAAWIQQHYRVVELIGAPPLHRQDFSILLFQRAAS